MYFKSTINISKNWMITREPIRQHWKYSWKYRNVFWYCWKFSTALIGFNKALQAESSFGNSSISGSFSEYFTHTPGYRKKAKVKFFKIWLNTVLCSYRERFYKEQIVIFREIISASIANKPILCDAKKSFCDQKKSVIWLEIWLERTI